VAKIKRHVAFPRHKAFAKQTKKHVTIATRPAKAR
jgi:hypothetical protein